MIQMIFGGREPLEVGTWAADLEANIAVAATGAEAANERKFRRSIALDSTWQVGGVKASGIGVRLG